LSANDTTSEARHILSMLMLGTPAAWAAEAAPRPMATESAILVVVNMVVSINRSKSYFVE
jgi:hypothetical protein